MAAVEDEVEGEMVEEVTTDGVVDADVLPAYTIVALAAPAAV